MSIGRNAWGSNPNLPVGIVNGSLTGLTKLSYSKTGSPASFQPKTPPLTYTTSAKCDLRISAAAAESTPLRHITTNFEHGRNRLPTRSKNGSPPAAPCSGMLIAPGALSSA